MWNHQINYILNKYQLKKTAMLWLGSIYFECLTIIINRWFLNSNKWLPSLLQMNPQSSEGPDKMKEQKDFWQSWLDATSYKNVCSVIFFSVRWLQVASTIWSSWLPRHLVNANATSSDTSYWPLSPGTIKLASYGWGKKSPKATWLLWPCLTWVEIVDDFWKWLSPFAGGWELVKR